MEPEHARRGLVFGLTAYVLWGVSPLYWRLLRDVAPVELIAHRALWSVACFVVLQRALGQAGALGEIVKRPRRLAAMALTGALLSGNSLTFVYAIATDHVVQVSLGYFINPLVSVLLGVAVLGERLRRIQWLAIGCAAGGVALMSIQLGTVPWIALVLALSFAFYGLVRKVAPVPALAGSTVETALILPIALAYLVWLGRIDGGLAARHGAGHVVLLVLCGVATAIPLAFFTGAARRLPLSTIGFLQFVAPSIQLVIAVVGFGEPFDSSRLISFGCIWLGLAIFTVDLVRAARRRSAAA